MLALECSILRHLFDDLEFAERVLPYLKEPYFYQPDTQLVYRVFYAFFEKHHVTPQFSAIRIGLDALSDINQRDHDEALTALDRVESEPALKETQLEWLLEQTEEFCKDRAVTIALRNSIKILDDPEQNRHAIADMLKEALAVNFDTHIGHDYFEDADARYEMLHRKEEKTPFDLDVLNRITRGGVPKKTLNVVLAGTNVGKSLFLCHYAAASLRMSKNVLYITCEMAEERIAERIDANLLNTPLDDFEDMPRGVFVRKMQDLRSRSTGRLIIKEYPTATCNVNHLRADVQELKLKQNFVPDIVIVDYLTIMASARIKVGTVVNSYQLYKFVAEELRGLFVELEVVGFTAGQLNRTGHASSDAELTDIGDSWGIAQTADFIIVLSQTEELEQSGQISLKTLKSRYSKKNIYQQELLGIDTTRMKLYDLAGTVTPMASPSPFEPSEKPSSFRSLASRRRPLSALREQAEGNQQEF